MPSICVTGAPSLDKLAVWLELTEKGDQNPLFSVPPLRTPWLLLSFSGEQVEYPKIVKVLRGSDEIFVKTAAGPVFFSSP